MCFSINQTMKVPFDQVFEAPRLALDVISRVVNNTDALNGVMKIGLAALDLAALHLEHPVLKPLKADLHDATKIVAIRNCVGGASDLMSGNIGCKKPFTPENPNWMAIVSAGFMLASNVTNTLMWFIEHEILQPEVFLDLVQDFIASVGLKELATKASEVGNLPAFRGITLKDAHMAFAFGGLIVDAVDIGRDIHDNGLSVESGMRILANIMRVAAMSFTGSTVYTVALLGGIAGMTGGVIMLIRFVQKEYKI